MKYHMRALPTPSANDGPGFHTNIPVSKLIERDTRAIEASVVDSAPPIAKTEDEVTRDNTADPHQTLKGLGARAGSRDRGSKADPRKVPSRPASNNSQGRKHR